MTPSAEAMLAHQPPSLVLVCRSENQRVATHYNHVSILPKGKESKGIHDIELVEIYKADSLTASSSPITTMDVVPHEESKGSHGSELV